MRSLVLLVAILAVGLKWYADACGHENTTPEPPNLTCLNGSLYKAIVFLVDGSSSMGNGNYTYKNGTTANNSVAWNVYNQWPNVMGLINGFNSILTNQFVIVMKQYSSPYKDECCPSCPENMTRVLRGSWTVADWVAAANGTYYQHQNCDTWTYTAIIDTVKIWEQKKKELKLHSEARALVILITDGEPSNEDFPNRGLAKETLAASSADVLLVHPIYSDNATTSAQKERNRKLGNLTELFKPSDVVPFNFAEQKVNETLRNNIVTKICEIVNQ